MIELWGWLNFVFAVKALAVCVAIWIKVLSLLFAQTSAYNFLCNPFKKKTRKTDKHLWKWIVEFFKEERWMFWLEIICGVISWTGFWIWYKCIF